MSSPDPLLAELLAHAPWARELARSLLDDPGAGDDCVQEAWIASQRRPPAADATPRAWMRRVLRNFALQRRRREDRRRRREAEQARSESTPSAEQLVERMEIRRVLAEEVLALAEPYRETIVLHFYEGTTSARIARHLGIPSATVRARLRRGVQMLRARLRERDADGRSWTAMLGALVATPETAARRASESSMPAAVQGIGAVLIVVGGAYVAWRWSAPPRSALVPASAESAGAVPDDVARRFDASDARESERRALAPASAERGTAAELLPEGWWLTAAVRAVGAAPVAGARVLVSPTAVFDDAPFSAVTGADGDVSIDVSELFLAVEGMPLRLFLRVDHPEHLPAEIELALTREERQGGFREGGAVRIAASCELAPAAIVISGQIAADRAEDAVIALYPAPAKDGAEIASSYVELALSTPLDVCRASEAGEYSLRAAAPGQHVLVVARDSSATTAFPSIVRSVELDAGETRLDLDVPPGAKIEGRVLLAGGRAGERCLVTARPRTTRGEDLAWTGRRFECLPRSVSTDEAGWFRFTGLATLDYELCVAGGSAEPGLETPTLWLGGAPGDPAAVVAEAPAAGVELRLAEHVARFLEIWRDGAPLAGARVNGDPLVASDGSGRVCLFFHETSAPEIEVSEPPSSPVRVQLDAAPVGAGSPVRVTLPDLGPRASLSIIVTEDEERELEAGVLELFGLGVDAYRAVGPRDSVWRGRVRRMRDGLEFRGLPAGRWQARFVPTGPGPEHGEVRSFCEEIFDLDLAPGDEAREIVVLRRGGWLRVLPHALGDSDAWFDWTLRDSVGAVVPTRLVRRQRHATMPVEQITLAQELETPAALPPGDYVLELRSDGEPPLERRFRIDVDRTTTLAPDAAR